MEYIRKSCNFRLGVDLFKRVVISRAYGTCTFIILPYVGTYPLNSLLNFLEQSRHPLANELDHCGMDGVSTIKNKVNSMLKLAVNISVQNKTL